MTEGTLSRSEIWAQNHSFSSGERILVHGPSGRGKSTFLNVVFGLETQVTGSLRIGETNPFANPILFWPSLRSHILSFVSQETFLFDGISGFQNLKQVPCRAKDVDRKKIFQWAEALRIESILERRPSSWSAGQKQRFSILRALIKPSEWILLDEPFSNLDPETQKDAFGLINEVCSARDSGWIMTSLTDEPPEGTTRSFSV